MSALGFSSERIAQLSARLHFANVSALSNQASFMQGVLNQWVSPSNVIVTSSNGDTPVTGLYSRFDGLYTWCAWPTAGQSGGLVDGGNACSALPAAVSSAYALAQLSEHCTLDAMVANAQNANAAGIVVVAQPGQALFQVARLSSHGSLCLHVTGRHSGHSRPVRHCGHAHLV